MDYTIQIEIGDADNGPTIQFELIVDYKSWDNGDVLPEVEVQGYTVDLPDDDPPELHWAKISIAQIYNNRTDNSQVEYSIAERLASEREQAQADYQFDSMRDE